MKITHAYRYSGGPLDGQTAEPTAIRGTQFTLYRSADGRALRPANADRWNRAENNEQRHPGFYARRSIVGVDTTTGTVLGAYEWRPPRE